MIPTVLQASDFIAALLGDVGRDTYDDSRIRPYLNSAWREMMTEFAVHSLESAKRKTYYLLPAYTGVIRLSTLGIADMGEPTKLEDRTNSASATITAADTNSPITVTTSAPHGRAIGDRVEIYGVGGQTGANGRFYVTATPTASQLTLGGSVTAGTYTSGGTVLYSGESFVEVDRADELDEGMSPGGTLTEWEWEQDEIRLIPATVARQIRLTYLVSGTPPTSGSLVIDDCLEFVGKRAAAQLAQIDGLAEWRTYRAEADVALRTMVQAQIRSDQFQERQPPPFQDRRILDETLF